MHRSKLALALLAALALALVARQSHAANFITLTSFNGTNGANPLAGVTLSSDGSTLYGTTNNGGAYGDGTVFSIPTAGGSPTVLASFNGTNGQGPQCDLTLIGTTFYGMTREGGANNDGTVFSVPMTGGTPTVLVSFNGTNGQDPQGSLTLSGSTLYGMTYDGGAYNYGTVFSVPVSGGTPTTLASFNGPDGRFPNGDVNLTLVGSTLYGMTEGGGAYGYGNIFSLPLTGGTPTNLYSFSSRTELTGGFIAIGSTLYGMTTLGGTHGDGTIFSIPTTGGTPNILASFNDEADPGGHLTPSADGSTLYGTASLGGANGGGAIFSIPTTGGTITTLYSFNGINGFPQSDLAIDANGSRLYGAVFQDGINHQGIVYALALVPEPSSVVLLGLGAIGLVATALRRRMRSKRPSAASLRPSGHG